jgi:hypothetical protein
MVPGRVRVSRNWASGAIQGFQRGRTQSDGGALIGTNGTSISRRHPGDRTTGAPPRGVDWPPGIDNAPYLTALVQSSLIAIPSGTAAEAAASMSHCRSGAAVSPQKADPIPNGRRAITSRKAMELWGTRANAGLLKALCVDPPNLRAPAIHPQGGARQAYSARSKQGRLVGDNYRPASAIRRQLRSLQGFQHSSSCGQRLHPIVPAVVSRNPHPCLSSQQA